MNMYLIVAPSNIFVYQYIYIILAPSHLAQTSLAVGSAAQVAEANKWLKYAGLGPG